MKKILFILILLTIFVNIYFIFSKDKDLSTVYVNNDGNFSEKTDNYEIKINYPLTGYKKLNEEIKKIKEEEKIEEEKIKIKNEIKSDCENKINKLNNEIKNKKEINNDMS